MKIPWFELKEVEIYFSRAKLRMAFEQFIKKSSPGRLSNFYIVEYCEIFKMAFSKISDLWRRLEIRSQVPTRYAWRLNGLCLCLQWKSLSRSTRTPYKISTGRKNWIHSCLTRFLYWQNLASMWMQVYAVNSGVEQFLVHHKNYTSVPLLIYYIP